MAGIGANNVAIVDAAKVPEKPSGPKLFVNVLLALLGGIGLSGLIALALEQIDEGLREPGQVGRQLQVPLLGSVPDVEDNDSLELLKDAKSAIS